MANKMQSGFVKADSRNLPKIDIFMVLEYVRNDNNFNAEEIQNAKLARSSRESYGDQAVGYVSLQRDGPLCIINCTVCPEHKVRSTNYRVEMKINEEEDVIQSVSCIDCAAAKGGCKHAIAFLMWLYRRNEEPAVTEVQCYWKKSVLSTVGTTKKFIKASEFNDNNAVSAPYTDDAKKSFLREFLATAEKKQVDVQFTRYFYNVKEREIMCLSIHQIMIEFKKSNSTTADEFILFAKTVLTQKLCELAELSSRSQNDSLLWHELRYGRVTASNLYQAAHCTKTDGSLVKTIIGAAKVFDNKYMKRGRELEKEVLSIVMKKCGFQCRKSGLILLPDFPVLGASPDAVGDDFILEIKCPGKESTVSNYLCNGQIKGKCKAQMQLQMLAPKTKIGYLCVAKPDFETTGDVEICKEDFDELYVQQVIEKATDFWKVNVFPRLMGP